MTFASPEWLLCLIALPLLGLAGWLSWKSRGDRWKRLLAPRLRKRLSEVRPSWVHFTALGLGLTGVCGLIIAFAQPESGEEWVEAESEGRNILLCVDISRSMLAEDLSPNRLQASRAAALEILERFPNDRIGVLLFSGEVLIQSPLTIDHGFVEQTLAQLDPNDIPIGGSSLAEAINSGISLLTETGQQSNIMVVLSDGEKSTEGLEAAASAAAAEGVFIYALGMGSLEGSFIPDPRERDGKFRDRSGNVVFSRLDEEALQILAKRTEGFYSRGMGSDFLSKLDSALAEMDRFREEGKHQRVAKPAHQWFVGGGLLLIMISIYLRGLPLGPAAPLAMLLFMAPLPSKAGLIDDGVAAMQAGESEAAYDHFRAAAKESSGDRAASLYLAAGSAASKARDWKSAVDAFSKAVPADDEAIQQKAHYALATSLFYLGAPLEKDEKTQTWKGAIEHFEASLELLPDHQESAANLEAVKRQLAELQKETPPEEQPQKEDEQKKEDKPKKEDEPQKEDESKDDQNDPPKGEQDQEPDEDKPDENGKPKESEDESKPEKDPKDQQGNEGEKKEPGKKDEGEDGEPEQSEDGKPDEPEEGSPEPNDKPEQNGDSKPSQGEPGAEAEGKDPGSEDELANADEPSGDENREERARRLLKQYADFGGKAPRRIRRSYNRSAHDW